MANFLQNLFNQYVTPRLVPTYQPQTYSAPRPVSNVPQQSSSAFAPKGNTAGTVYYPASTPLTPTNVKSLSAPSSGGSGNGGGGSLSAPQQSVGDPSNDGGQYYDAAAAQAEAERQAIENAYSQNEAQLQQNLKDAQTAQGSAETDIGRQVTEVGTSADSQKGESQKLTDVAIGQAGDTARNTQRSNRDTLRALGILGSSYAADKLMAPNNAFDQERARLVQLNNENYRKVDEWKNSQVTKLNDTLNNVKSQYASIIANINNDIRFNGQQKSQALAAAQSALMQRFSSISDTLAQVQQQAQTAKQNVALQIAQLQLNQNPSANLSGILSSSMQFANQITPQSVGIYQGPNTDELKKKYPGLLSQ